jgi:hypothetical protein
MAAHRCLLLSVYCTAPHCTALHRTAARPLAMAQCNWKLPFWLAGANADGVLLRFLAVDSRLGEGRSFATLPCLAGFALDTARTFQLDAKSLQ